MAKRLLLSIVCCFVSVSFSYAQCDKTLLINLNGTFTYTSDRDRALFNYDIFFCEGNTNTFKFLNIESEKDLSFKWYKNDILIPNAQSSILETSQEGVYIVEIKGKDCNYKVGPMSLKVTKNMNISLPIKELTICENVASPTPLWGSTNISSVERTYQWQKDGKDIPNATDSYFNPSTSGVYTLRISTGNCSATSAPAVVKASTNNKISDYIYVMNRSNSEIKTDSIFLCSDNSYELAAANGTTNWYKNGQLIENSYTFSLKESGNYYIQRKLTENCTLESKPLYISLGQTIKPLNINNNYYNILACDQALFLVDDPNIMGNIKLELSDFNTGEVKETLLNLSNYTGVWSYLGKFNVNFETGTCKSPISTIEVKQKSYIVNNRKERLGKKVSLCPNSSIELNLDYVLNDEVLLYRNDTLIQRKSPEMGATTFMATQKGKYYFKIIQATCNPVQAFLSDTVEVDIPNQISTALDLVTEDCTAGKYTISAKEYAGYTYSWYKNNTLIPDSNLHQLKIFDGGIGSYHAVIQKDLCAVNTRKINIGEKIQGSSIVCQYNKINLSSNTTEGTSLWKGPNNFNSNQFTISIDSADAKHAGWYILKTTRNGCTFTDSLQIKVPTRPNVSISFLNPLCVNKQILISLKGAPGAYFLKFRFYDSSVVGIGMYLSSSQGNANEVSATTSLGILGNLPANHGKEFLNLENEGCLFPVPVPPRLSEKECENILDFLNVKDKYCIKENINLEFRIPENIPANIKFNLRLETLNGNFNLGSLSGNKAAIQIPEVGYSTVGFFILESEDGKHKIISKTVNISNVRPSIYHINGNYQTENAVHCKGYTIKISSYNANYQKLQWRKDGVAIPGVLSDTLEVVEDGYYTLAASYEGCTEESRPVRLTTVELPRPYISSLIGNKRACEGFSVPLVEDQSYNYTSYQWKHDGKLVETKQANDIFEAKKTGYYSLTAMQGSCQVTSDSIFIEIGHILSNSISGSGEGIMQDNKIILCDSSSFNLYSNNYSGYYKYPDILKKHGLSFQWRLDNKNIPGATNNYHLSTKAGKYRLQVKQGDCIVNSNEIEVINQNPARIKLSSNYYDATPNSDSPDTLTTITICKGDSVRIHTPYNTGYYSWNKELYKDGKLIDNRTIENNSSWNNNYSLGESGKYSLKLYSAKHPGCYVISDTLTVRITEKPMTWPTDTVYSCNEMIGKYTQTLGFRYEWIHENKIIGTEHFIETNKLGLLTLKVHKSDVCYIEKSYFIENKLKPIINKYPPSTSSSIICSNDKLSLSVGNLNDIRFGNDPGLAFEWYKDEKKLPYTVGYIEANESGNYFAKVKYKECEATSNVIKLDVMQIKNQISPSIDSMGVCINGGFQKLEVGNEIGYTYEWFRDTTALKETSAILKATETGIYKALIQFGNCSAITSKVKIYASTQLPTATISGDTTLNIGDTANMKLAFTSSPPFTYKLSNNQEGTTDKNTIIHPVKIQESTVFKLASIKNACGEGTVSGEAKINVIILGNEPLIGHKITVAPVPAESYCEIIIDLPVSQEVSYQLLDMKGQQLSEKNLGNVSYKKQYLNLNHLTAGEYLIRVQVGKDFVTRKLIKY